MPTLQMQNHHNIFALGDIIDWPETKQLTKISFGHAPVVIANVMNYLEGRLPKREYTKSTEIMLISIGRVCGTTSSNTRRETDAVCILQTDGASYLGCLWGLTFGGFLTRYIKSNDLLVGYNRRNIGLPYKCEPDADSDKK